jgi:hypothetical protein
MYYSFVLKKHASGPLNFSTTIVKLLLFKLIVMQELINRLTSKVGLNEQQAQQAVQVIAGFIKEKYPMLGSSVDTFLKGQQAGSGFNIPGFKH